MATEPGVQPGGGIAKTFTAVLAPAARAPADVARGERRLSPFGRPAQFAARAGAEFGAQKILVPVPRRVPHAQPDEVPQFVYENAGEFGARAMEGDAAFAEKSSGVNGTAMVADAGRGLYADGGA